MAGAYSRVLLPLASCCARLRCHSAAVAKRTPVCSFPARPGCPAAAAVAARLPPSEHLAAGGSFEDLKDLIEGAVEQAGRPVIGISLRCGHWHMYYLYLH